MKKKQGRKFREFSFIFLSKALSRENTVIWEWGFPLCKIGREYRESEFNFKSLFSSWKRKVGVPWASVVFLSPLDICICIFICSDEWWKTCLIDNLFSYSFLVWSDWCYLFTRYVVYVCGCGVFSHLLLHVRVLLIIGQRGFGQVWAFWVEKRELPSAKKET